MCFRNESPQKNRSHVMFAVLSLSITKVSFSTRKLTQQANHASARSVTNHLTLLLNWTSIVAITRAKRQYNVNCAQNLSFPTACSSPTWNVMTSINRINAMYAAERTSNDTPWRNTFGLIQVKNHTIVLFAASRLQDEYWSDNTNAFTRAKRRLNADTVT